MSQSPKTWLLPSCHQCAMWPWEAHLTSPSLSFPIYKMQIIPFPPLHPPAISPSCQDVVSINVLTLSFTRRSSLASWACCLLNWLLWLVDSANFDTGWWPHCFFLSAVQMALAIKSGDRNSPDPRFAPEKAITPAAERFGECHHRPRAAAPCQTWQ